MSAIDDHSVTCADQPFRVGDWQVEPTSGRIRQGGRSIKLEPRVMDLLVYLAGRPGRVITRAELETAVWAGRVVGYDALTGSMQKLRRALADDARQPHIIETLSKKGYRLLAPVVMPAAADPPADSSPDSPVTGVQRENRSVHAGIAALGLLLMTAIAYFFYGPWRIADTTQDLGSTPASIAVLPFDNLGGDPEQEYFADGMTDDLITELAKIPDLFVIARDSTFFYKGQPIDLHEVADKLRVRYILHGSVRRAGEQIRLNARLTDAASGRHLWAERYDGTLNNVFALQDEITRRILAALPASMHTGDPPDAPGRKTSSATAYDYFLLGRNRFFRYASREENRKARELYRQAIALDPEYALAYAMLAWTHVFDAMNGWSEVREQSLERGYTLAGRAITLDPNLPVAYFVTGLVYRERGEYLKALVEAEKAIALDPNYANAHVLLATLFYYTGRPQEGLERIQKAMRLNPYHPYNYPFHLGQAYFILGRYPEAIDAFRQGLASNPSAERLRVWLTAACAQSGQIEDAEWEAEQILALNPDFSTERIRNSFPFKDPADLERFLEGLRLAGLSE